MAANPRSTITTVEAYLEHEARAHSRSEYVDGQVLGMAGGTLEHSQIIQNLTSMLDTQLEAQNCRVFGSDMLVRVSHSRYYYPDTTVVCGKPRVENRRGVDVLTNPRLVIEVLSPSTERRDRREKRLAYMQNETIQEILLITPEEAYVERLRRLPDGNWVLDTVTGLESDLVLEAVPATLPLRRLYRFVIEDAPPQSL